MLNRHFHLDTVLEVNSQAVDLLACLSHMVYCLVMFRYRIILSRFLKLVWLDFCIQFPSSGYGFQFEGQTGSILVSVLLQF